MSNRAGSGGSSSDQDPSGCLPLEVFSRHVQLPNHRWKMIYLIWLGSISGSFNPDATSGKILCSKGQAISNKHLAGEWMSHVSIIVRQRLKRSNQQTICGSKEKNKNMFSVQFFARSFASCCIKFSVSSSSLETKRSEPLWYGHKGKS